MRLTWYSVEKFAHIHLAKINKNSSYVNFHFVSSTRAHRLTLSLLRLHRVRFVSYMTDFKNTSPHIRIKRVHMRCMEDSNRKQKKNSNIIIIADDGFFSLLLQHPLFFASHYTREQIQSHIPQTHVHRAVVHTPTRNTSAYTLRTRARISHSRIVGTGPSYMGIYRHIKYILHF